MKIVSSAQTHVGNKRSNNEDSFLVDDKRRLYAIADGLGGHACGEVASKIAVDTLQKTNRTRGYNNEFFARAFRRAHQEILNRSRDIPDSAGMGSTLTACAINPHTRRLHVGHSGDSALFLITNGCAAQVTRDESVGHRLTSCLGVSMNAFHGVQYDELKVIGGDVIVIASDGLTRYLRGAKHLGELVNSNADLIEFALSAGGDDNVTVIVLRILA